MILESLSFQVTAGFMNTYHDPVPHQGLKDFHQIRNYHGFDFKKLYQLVQIPCPLCPLESRVKGLWLIVAPMF